MSNHPKAEKAAKEIRRMMAEGRTRNQSDYERLDNVQCHIGNLLGEIAELEARVAELDRLNTDLAMESHALQGRVAELEALVNEITVIVQTFPNKQEFLRPKGKTATQWMKDAMRLCPPDPQEDWCHAGRDGDCIWKECPQKRDGEPKATGRHCPLDTPQEDA